MDFAEIKKLPEEIRRMISSFKKTETTFGEDGKKVIYEIKFIDKMKAFEMLNRHIGFYEEDNTQQKENITVTIGK